MDELMYWCDFYPDFCWRDSTPELKALLADEEWMELAQKVYNKTHVDFIKEINESLLEQNI